MTEKDGHFGDAALAQLHKNITGTTEDGACLTGHEARFSRFERKRSCNYRYQAYEQAKAQDQIRARLHLYKKRLSTGPIKTSAYQTDAGGQAPHYYCAELPFPGDGDWDVGGPSKDIIRVVFNNEKIKIKTGMNFTQDTWPYWNNAHHLIPKGTLKERIVKEGAQVSDLIQKMLLDARYNINHKINMLFLPQDREVAELLELPRHLQLKDGDGQVYVSVPCTDHPVYSEMVLEIAAGLNKIIQGYRKICDQNGQGVHKSPNAALDKRKLEDLSRRLLKLLLKWGQSKYAGMSLDQLADYAKQNSSSSSNSSPKFVKV